MTGTTYYGTILSHGGYFNSFKNEITVEKLRDVIKKTEAAIESCPEKREELENLLERLKGVLRRADCLL